MKALSLAALLLLALLILSCGAGEPAPTHDDDPAKATEERHNDPEGEHMLEIEESMRRDLRITTTRVARHAADERVRLVGEVTVDANRYVEVGVPMEARVEALLGEPGDEVSRGASLARLQSAELGAARAALYTAEARLVAARATVERNRSLGVGRIVPQREMDDTLAALAAAESDVRAAKASLEALGAPLEHEGDASLFDLTSPLSGTIIERKLVRGQVVSSETVAFRVADVSQLWIVARAFERDAVRIVAGSVAAVELTAFPGRAFEAVVTRIGQEVEASSRTIPIRLEIANPDGLLRPGMSALVRVSLGESGDSVLVVPTSAVQRVADGWAVFVPKGHHAFEVREIGRGRDLEGEIEIVSGLTEGEDVVVDGAFLLKAELEKRSGGGDAHGH